MIRNPLYHLDAVKPLSIAYLRDAVAQILQHAIGPDSAPLHETKDVVVRIGSKTYPLSEIAVGFHGGSLVLELIATDVPPCQYCGRVGNHDMDQPCSAWEHMNADTATEDGRHG